MSGHPVGISTVRGRKEMLASRPAKNTGKTSRHVTRTFHSHAQAQFVQQQMVMTEEN
jgi:hypothetical protein